MSLKRAFVTLCAVAAAIGIAGSAEAASPPPAKPKAPQKVAKHPAISKWQQHVNEMLHVSAPGDAYFGRMKMSYLGINNTFHDSMIRAGAYTTDPRIIGQVEWAMDALQQWSREYPNDPQLARSYFLAFEIYRKIWTQPAQTLAWQYMHIIVQRWPSTFFGKTMKADLARGFTEHYFATAVPCPPTPSPSPTPGRGRPTPTPTATPVPATPTPSPAPGQPAVEVLPVPCFTPLPTPMPSLTPSALPSALPSGAASISPSPSPSVSPTPH